MQRVLSSGRRGSGSGDIATLRNSDFQLVETSAGADTVLPDNGIAPFDDLRVRQALSMALDRRALVDSVGVPATGTIPHDHPFCSEAEDFPGLDVAVATALIDEYESETGEDVAVTLSFDNRPIDQELAQLIQACWQAIGVDAELAAPVPVTDLLNQVPWIMLRDQVQGLAARPGVEGLEDWTPPAGSPGTYKQFWVPFTVDSVWSSE